jgi:hypothetical protein
MIRVRLLLLLSGMLSQKLLLEACCHPTQLGTGATAGAISRPTQGPEAAALLHVLLHCKIS